MFKKYGRVFLHKLFIDAGVVWTYSLPRKTPKAYGFHSANKISKSTTASGSANFNNIVISVFNSGENQEAIKLFDMKKSPDTQKLNTTWLYTNIQPVAKDQYEIHVLENKCIRGDVIKTEFPEGKDKEWLARVA